MTDNTLFKLQNDILNDIARSFQVSTVIVEKVYTTCLTFDKTIKIFDVCQQYQMDPILVINVINQIPLVQLESIYNEKT